MTRRTVGMLRSIQAEARDLLLRQTIVEWVEARRVENVCLEENALHVGGLPILLALLTVEVVSADIEDVVFFGDDLVELALRVVPLVRAVVRREVLAADDLQHAGSGELPRETGGRFN